MIVGTLASLLIAAALYLTVLNLGREFTTPDFGVNIRIPEDAITLLKIAALVIASRFAIYFVAEFIYMHLNEKPFDFMGHFRSIWARWDTTHYLRIARTAIVISTNIRLT